MAAAAKLISWCWSDLPTDVLILIVERLDSADDEKRFRAVCRSWRFSVNPPPPPVSIITRFRGLLRSFWKGFHIYHRPYSNENYDFQFFEVSLNCFVHLPTGKQWLVRVREIEKDAQVEINDPFGRSFSLFEDPTNNSKVINLLNFRVSLIRKLYYLHPLNFDINDTHNVVRVRMSNSSTIPNYPIVASIGSGLSLSSKIDGRVKFRGCLIHNETLLPFHAANIVEYKQNFYMFDAPGCVKIIELPRPNPMVWIGVPSYQGRFPIYVKYYLISFAGHLFLVQKPELPAWQYVLGMKQGSFPAQTVVPLDNYIQVFKLDDEQPPEKWVQLTDLGVDGALFLCEDQSYGVCVQQFAGIERGLIYFLEYDPVEHDNLVVWGFNLENGTLRHGLLC